MKQKISITGSTSKLGLETIKNLENENFSLNLSTRKKNKLKLKNNNNFYFGNLKNKKFVYKLINNTNCVVNLAYDSSNYSDNLLITKNIISVANCSPKIKKIIHCSTAVVATNATFNKVGESFFCKPKNRYQLNKLQIENELLKNLSKKIELIIIRPTEISDYNNKKSTIFKFQEKCKKKNLKNILFHLFLGARNLNFVSIDNVKNSIIFFIKKKNKVDKKKNIFFVSEDSKNKNFNYYCQFLLKEPFTPFFFNCCFYKEFLKFIFIFLLKKPNPFQVYSNYAIKKIGFKFKNNVQKQLLKMNNK